MLFWHFSLKCQQVTKQKKKLTRHWFIFQMINLSVTMQLYWSDEGSSMTTCSIEFAIELACTFNVQFSLFRNKFCIWRTKRWLTREEGEEEKGKEGSKEERRRKRENISCVSIQQPHPSKGIFVDRLPHSGATKTVPVRQLLQMWPTNPLLWRIQLVDPLQPKMSQDSLHAAADLFLFFELT